MENQSHAHAHAHGAHTREGERDLLSPDFVFQFYLAWKELEDQIQDLQDSKKSMIANVRSRYSRHHAEALKITMRRALMDKNKRAEAAVFNDMATYYVDLLEADRDARVNNV